MDKTILTPLNMYEGPFIPDEKVWEQLFKDEQLPELHLYIYGLRTNCQNNSDKFLVQIYCAAQPMFFSEFIDDYNKVTSSTEGNKDCLCFVLNGAWEMSFFLAAAFKASFVQRFNAE